MRFCVQHKIPELNKLLVQRYIFQELRKINDCILPEIIIYLCIMFFNLNVDDWVEQRVHSTIKIYESTIKRISDWGRKGAILSNVATVGLHIWRFQIIKSGFDLIEIGIIPVPLNNQKCICYGLSYGGYALWKNFVSANHFRCTTIKRMDIIVLKLHFAEKKVTFWLNNKFVGEYEIIETSYSAAVTLTDNIAEVKLLSYQQFVV